MEQIEACVIPATTTIVIKVIVISSTKAINLRAEESNPQKNNREERIKKFKTIRRFIWF